MITLQKIGDAIKFTFSGNTHYLQDGTVEVPVNSLSLTIDDSGMATFRKSASNDIFISATYGELGMTKDELVAWYKENMVDGGGSDITSGDVQSMIDESISGKQDTLIAGENITISGNVISAAGGNNAIELTQAEYDALVSAGTIDPSAFYIITDATPIDLSNYYTSAQTNNAINAAVSGKVDTSTFNTYSGSVDTALSGKQDTLSAGTGIEISGNVISATGGGGGKAVSGGTNISITTGDTADTINCTIPVSADTNNPSYGVISNYTGNTAGHMSFAGGYITNAKKSYSFAFGMGAETNNYHSTAIGQNTKATCWGETAFGCHNNSVSANTNFDGNSGNTLFSVGNGTASNIRHNAIEIRQNGDIYIADTNDTTYQNYYEKPMIKLQDKFSSLDTTIGNINTILESI